MFTGCYIDKYAVMLLMGCITIFFIQKCNQKKILQELEKINTDKQIE